MNGADRSAADPSGAPARRDVVGLAVMTNRMEGVVRKMTNTLFRTARSTVLNTARDFSCCIVSRDDELLVMAESLPIHVMSGPDLVSRWLKRFHPTLRRGDAFLHNSPYHGNSHAGDHCLIVPVIDDDGVHRVTAFVKAHLADIGNAQPTTISAMVRDVYEEGALIFPCVKVQENYADVADIVRMCEARIRVPEDWYGDYIGMIGAARVGERELLKVGAEVGWNAFDCYVKDWLDYSEERARATIRTLPSGTRTTRNAYDPLPFPGLENGVPLAVTVTIDAQAGEIQVDLRNNPDCVPCGINLTESTATTAALIGVFNSIDHEVPRNSGSARCLPVLLRENCVAGIPVHPASCSTATSGVAERIASLVQLAMSEFGEGYGMAETGPECPPAVAGLSGRDPRRGNQPFVDMMILGNSAGAGHAHGDGWLTNGEVSDGGMMMRDSTEVIELLRPIRIWADRIITDTEGAGRFRGAPSLYVEYGPVDTELEVMYAPDGCVNPALGARGGHSGTLLRGYKRLRSGEVEELDANGHVILARGETIISVSPSGGGYGPPIERDPDRVRRDVIDRWISREHAASVYGVILRADGGVDDAATAARRAELAAAVGASPPRENDPVMALIEPGTQLWATLAGSVRS
jgi:N-methylhydantoinase B